MTKYSKELSQAAKIVGSGLDDGFDKRCLDWLAERELFTLDCIGRGDIGWVVRDAEEQVIGENKLRHVALARAVLAIERRET